MENLENKDALVGEMGSLIELISKKRSEIDQIELTVKALNKELKTLEEKALSLLEGMGLKSYPSPFGTVTARETWRVNVPQGDNREKFFSFLKDKGLGAMMTVNSNTLNSYFNKEWQAAIDSGRAMEFSIPGIGEPSRYVSLSLRK